MAVVVGCSMPVKLSELLWMTWADTADDKANTNPAAIALSTSAFLVMPPFSLARNALIVFRGDSMITGSSLVLIISVLISSERGGNDAVDSGVDDDCDSCGGEAGISGVVVVVDGYITEVV